MTHNPIEVRRALMRFPRWTQPLWTAITALAPPGDRARPRRAWMHIAMQLLSYGSAMALGIGAVQQLMPLLLALC